MSISLCLSTQCLRLHEKEKNLKAYNLSCLYQNKNAHWKIEEDDGEIKQKKYKKRETVLIR